MIIIANNIILNRHDKPTPTHKFDAGMSAEYLRITNRSFYNLLIQYENNNATTFPARWKEDIPTPPNFTGKFTVTPLAFIDPTLLNGLDINPQSQSDALLSIVAFGSGEIDVPTCSALPPSINLLEFATSAPWTGTGGSSVNIAGVVGFCLVLDQIDLDLLIPGTTSVDYTVTVSYTSNGIASTVLYNYDLQGTTTTVDHIVDHILFQKGAIVGDVATQITIVVTTSATVGTHKNGFTVQYHVEFPF